VIRAAYWFIRDTARYGLVMAVMLAIDELS
jgi:hypothetical protein